MAPLRYIWSRAGRIRQAGCLALLCLLATTSRGFGQTLDEYVRGQMTRHQIPGLAIVVARDGQLLAARGYGLANVEHGVPVTPETIFEIASVTKPMTAVGVMLLVQDGRVGLDAPINTYLDGLPASWSAITVRHALSHTSGLKDYLNDRLVDRQRLQTSQEILSAVFPEPLLFVPGARWSYSNTNYLALELVIERVTGDTFGRFLADRVLGPSGMVATGRRDLNTITPGRAAHYDLRNDRVVNAEYLNPTVWDHGDGGLVSTAPDLLRFDMAVSGSGLVLPATRELLWTAPRLEGGDRAPYGLGWELGDVLGVRYVGHSGGRAGVSAIYVRYLDAGLTVIVLSNLSGVNLRREVADGVAGLYEPRLRPLQGRQAEAAPDAAQQAAALAYLQDVADGKQDSLLVTPGNRRAVAAPQRSLAGMLAERQSFGSLGCEALADRDLERQGTRIDNICHYRMITPTRVVHLSLYLASGGRVADQEVDVTDRPAPATASVPAR